MCYNRTTNTANIIKGTMVEQPTTYDTTVEQRLIKMLNKLKEIMAGKWERIQANKMM